MGGDEDGGGVFEFYGGGVVVFVVGGVGRVDKMVAVEGGGVCREWEGLSVEGVLARRVAVVFVVDERGLILLVGVVVDLQAFAAILSYIGESCAAHEGKVM